MATIELVKEAISAMKDRTGSSLPAINKWIESEKKVSSIGCFLFFSLLRALRKPHDFLQIFGFGLKMGVLILFE